jgi:hypothetical protein
MKSRLLISLLLKHWSLRDLENGGFDEEFASSDSLTAFLAFAKEEKEGKEPIDSLFQELEYDDRQEDAAKSLLLFLFPRLGGRNYHEEDMPESINRVRNRDAFLKLLHCGVASFTYSADQARRFCTRPGERRHILADYRDAGDLINWLSYFTTVSVECEIEEPIQLCDVLLAEMRGPESEGNPQSQTHHVGKLLYEIIKSCQDGSLRWSMLERLVSSKISLAVSESTLLGFLVDFGIFQNGEYVDDLAAAKARSNAKVSDLSLFSYEQLYTAKDRWLASVRDVAGSEDIMKTQKDVLRILFGWGQLNGNDFSEPQSYVMKMSDDYRWLQSYLQLFDPELNGRSLLKFIPDGALDIFTEKVIALAQLDEHASKFVDFLQQNQKTKAEKEHPTS